MWRRLVWEKCTNVSDELAASIMINEPAASSTMSEHIYQATYAASRSTRHESAKRPQ
jgi:hypothetical protein